MSEVWISAGVAAMVTLAIEYLAKPNMDARKDRILAASRSARELRTTIHHLYRSIINLTSDPIWEAGSDFAATELVKCDSLNEKVTDLTIESIGRLPSGLPEQLGGATGIVKGALLRVRQELDCETPVAHHVIRLKEVEPVIEQCVRFFDLPRWRVLERLRAKEAIREAREAFAT